MRINRIYTSKIILIMIIFSYLKPSGFDLYGYGTINSILNIIKAISALIIFFDYLSSRQGKVSSFFFTELVALALIGLSTFINATAIASYMIWAVSILSLTCLVERGAEINYLLLIDSFFYCYFALIVGNLVWMLTEVGWGIDGINGYVGESFLSSVNMQASYLFPGIVVAVLYSLNKGRKITVSAFILMLSSFITALMVWSATSMLGIVLLLAYYLFVFRRKIETIFPSVGVMIMSIILLIAVTFFRVQYAFSWLIVNIFHKSLSMTGRTYFWDLGLKYFMQSPIWGKGKEFVICDNGLVQMLATSGIIGMISLIYLLIILFKKIIRHVNSDSIENSKFYMVVFSVIFIMSISESWSFFMGFYLIMAFADNFTVLKRNVNNENSNKVIVH